MPFPYKNPINATQLSGPDSVPRNVTYGTNFSVLEIGGYMEVYSLQDLIYTIPYAVEGGAVEFTGNTIPIRLYIADSTDPTDTNFVTLNSDNISSGRRRLGMLAFVQETKKTYQYTIDNYETLWDNLSGLTGLSAVTFTNYTTTINGYSQAGRDFINAWTASTIEGVSGVTRDNARWKIFNIDVFVTGGTYDSVTSTILFTNNTSHQLDGFP